MGKREAEADPEASPEAEADPALLYSTSCLLYTSDAEKIIKKMTHCRIHRWYIIQFFSKGLSRVELELAHFFSFISTLGKCVFNGPPQWTLIQTPQETSNITRKKPLKGPPAAPQKLVSQNQ